MLLAHGHDDGPVADLGAEHPTAKDAAVFDFQGTSEELVAVDVDLLDAGGEAFRLAGFWRWTW